MIESLRAQPYGGGGNCSIPASIDGVAMSCGYGGAPLLPFKSVSCYVLVCGHTFAPASSSSSLPGLVSIRDAFARSR